MVSEVSSVNGGEGAERTTEVLPALAVKPEGLPPGKYALVGWDMDTTGRRLIDEICQIAAYTPDAQYSQYIMPHSDLNPSARRRYNLRVVTVGRYRMLKDNRTNKVLKTKSEITALTDFLDWLEKQKGEANSVILIYHEPRRLNPIMLLDAMIKYNLLDRFQKLVSGFCDCYALAAEKCKDTVKSVALHALAKVLLDANNMAIEGALDKATAAYRIVEHLSQGDQQEVGGGGVGDAIARVWSRPVRTELEARADLRCLLERQNTFRSVFAPLLFAPRPQRRHITMLRRHLAVAGMRYEQLSDAWQKEQLEGITRKLSELSTTAKEEEIKELVEIFDCHFDPEKEPKSFKFNKNSRFNNKGSTSGTEAATGSADSESASPSQQQSPSKQGAGDGSQ